MTFPELTLFTGISKSKLSSELNNQETRKRSIVNLSGDERRKLYYLRSDASVTSSDSP